MMVSDVGRFTLGADSDLKIYHDGTNANVDTITGALNIQNSSANPTEIILDGIPTSDPATAGQLWNDAGTLKISAG